MAPLTSSKIFLTLAVIASVVGFLVLVEMGRRAFSSASRRTAIAGIFIAAILCGLVLATWGAWPSWKTLTADSTLATLRLMQFFTQKTDLLNQVLAVVLGLFVILFGRHFHSGFRTHTQQIVIGLSTASISEMSVRGIWQLIAMHAAPQSEAEYEKVMGLQDKLYNASSVIMVLVIVWWIVCLWRNEPGSAPAAANPQPATPEPASEPQA
jgi:asparagine N-glycosylation enzyme membrane subunit Stt3